MKKYQVKVINEVGLHARPAAIFVQTANKYKSSIRVRNVTNGHDFVDAKSILGVLVLGVAKDNQIEIEINGEDEAEAASVLQKMIETDFQGLL
jgi:phosphocarrier protein HPr